MRGLAPFVFILLALTAGPAIGCAAVLGLDSGNARDQLEDGGTVDAGGGLIDQGGLPPVDGAGGDVAAPHGCAAGERLCGNTCAKSNDPAYGCGAASCQECSLPHTATTACEGGACVVAPNGCDPGFADCDMSAATGCEADLSTPATCGACGNKCSGVNNMCQTPNCVSACVAPLPDLCMGACVDAKNNPTHCGTSCVDCSAPNSTPKCSAGLCGFTCNAGYGDCNAGAGCETQTNTDSNCGLCGNDCSVPTPKHTTGACQGNFCSPTKCETGWNDCDGNLADGCECAGAGCCTPTDGAPPPIDSGGSCLPPGSTCSTGGGNTCCGACRPGVPCAPVPFLLTPGKCCALGGQMCGTAADCCNTSATCAGTCSS